VVSCDKQEEAEQEVDGYRASIVPDDMTVGQKKERFFALLVPPTQKVYQENLKRFEDVSGWIQRGEKKRKIKELKEEFKAETNQQLLAALKPHPPSIALAQAALESAWGTSRFFVEANNIFGVWSFHKDEPRIAASRQRGDKTIWLREYNSLEDSVRHYYRVLARGHAHQHFRDLRLETDDPYQLVQMLDQYSELREVYVNELVTLMRFNNLTRYDPVVYEYNPQLHRRENPQTEAVEDLAHNDEEGSDDIPETVKTEK
jgi:Bax protein